MSTATTERPRGAQVRLTGIGRTYGESHVVQDVDLTAGGGEVLALLGPSGCGKTTTLRMIAGLVAPTSGDITIDGQSVVGLPVHRRNLGMLFQDYALFPHMTVLHNVAFGLQMRGVGKAEITARAREALRLVRLEGYEERMPAQLSGGQRQRVALARAIVYRPRVLLLDEPFGALDKKLREEMQIELRQLCNDLGLTTIIVTHDQEEALILADRIAVMKDGRIEQTATPEELVLNPATPYVEEFTRHIPRAKVMKLRSVMSPGVPEGTYAGELSGNLTVDAAIGRIDAAAHPFKVTDDEGAAVGTIDARTAIDVMIGRASA